jgi:hypothetical protein
MGKVESIEAQVASLSAEELAAFRQWFAAFDEAHWDRRIAADSRAGRLDAMVAEARAEYDAGKTRDL